ncbi:MAG: hypothetical protein WCK98_00570 [bacterium]
MINKSTKINQVVTFNQHDEINNIISHKLSESSRLILLIDGVSGTGKTTLSKKIFQKYPQTGLVALDQFHYPNNHKGFVKYDYKRLVNQVITPFKKSQFPIKYQAYNFGDAKGLDYDGLDQWITVNETSLLIIEGFSASKLSKFCDLTIWIESDLNDCINRAVKRNVEEYGLKPLSDEEKGVWISGQKSWIAKNEPANMANIILKTKLV